MASKRQMHLGLFILGTGSHIAGWRYPGAVTSFQDREAIQQIARTAERGKFDLIFMGDNLYADPAAHPLLERPDEAPKELKRIRLDTYVGMAFSNLIAFFVILTTAVTLNMAGHTDIQTSAQAAEALRPLAGDFAFLLFSLGIIGTGLLALPVLAGSAAYAICESQGWQMGLEKKPMEAIGFYTVIGLATLLGLAVDYSPLDPIKALFWSAVINGVIAVPIMAAMMIVASRKHEMGQFIATLGQRILGWTVTAVMAAATAAMFAFGAF